MTTYTTNTEGRAPSAFMNTLKARISAITNTLEFRVLTILATVLMLWAAAVAMFGWPAFIVVLLALVPLAFFMLLMITVGK